MSMLDLLAKLKNYPVKTIIFRRNLPAIVDYATRVDKGKYQLLKKRHKFPSPPSNEHIQLIDGQPTIFLICPRIGTYFYMKVPEYSYDPEKAQMKIKYLTRVADAKGMLVEGDFSSVPLTIDFKNNKVLMDNKDDIIKQLKEKEIEYSKALTDLDKKGKTAGLLANKNKWTKEQTTNYKAQLGAKKKEWTKILNQIKVLLKQVSEAQELNWKLVETCFELFDHEDLTFIAREVQESESKYTKKEKWWDKYGMMIMNMAVIFGIVIAMWIMYEKVVLSAASHIPRDTLNVVCNITNQGAVI